MENKDQKTSGSGLMLSSLWCDVFNLIIGIGLLINGILIPGIGYILIRLISIFYMMFYKQLGFKYHVRTTRNMMMFCEFLLAYTLFRYDHPIWGYTVAVHWTTICSLTCMYDLWPDTQYEATEDIEREDNGVEDWDCDDDE